MKILDLSNLVNREVVNDVVFVEPNRMNVTVRDLMYSVKDGAMLPCAVKHYLDVVLRDTYDGFILPQIGDMDCLKRIARELSSECYIESHGTALVHIH